MGIARPPKQSTFAIWLLFGCESDRAAPPLPPALPTRPAPAATTTGEMSAHLLRPPDLLAHAPALVGGHRHVCAVSQAYELWCWGSDQFGQTAGHDGTCKLYDEEPCSKAPRKVEGLSPIRQVVASGDTTCVLDESRHVLCTGTIGALVDATLLETLTLPAGDTPDRVVKFVRGFHAIDALTGARQIATGGASICGIYEGGTVRCFGDNRHGQLGVGDRQSRTTAVAPLGLQNVVDIAAAGTITCARTEANALYCWGSSLQGQVGNGTVREFVDAPARIAVDNVAQIAAGGSHTCALTHDGAVYCFGANQAAAVGQNEYEDYSTPVRVANLGKALRVSATGVHTCASMEDGRALCWGMPLGGEQRKPGAKPPGPLPVPGAPRARAVFAASYGTFVLGDRGLYTWGDNSYGKLGSGDTKTVSRALKLDGFPPLLTAAPEG